MSLYEKPKGVKTRWISFENTTTERGKAALENKSAKGHAFDNVRPGETKTLLDIQTSGSIRKIWLTINDRSPEMLRGLKLEMYWDGSERPAVSAPLGDFFGISLGRRVQFECALFSDPEGRSFNCFIPMPFRTAARVTLTNELDRPLPLLFYDIDVLIDEQHSDDVLYFHTHWRREAPNSLGQDFDILPWVPGAGRFLGCNFGVITDSQYEGSWFGEGEVKAWFGKDAHPTLCGTGTEDYIGTGWGQGKYIHRTQGCSIADDANGHWAFYRYHVDDPVYFDDGCRIVIQTIGGAGKGKTIKLQNAGVPLIPISLHPLSERGFIPLLELDPPQDIREEHFEECWCNFWRQDDWSVTAYFYLDQPGGCLPDLQPVHERIANLGTVEGTDARADA